jgi:hypothetical protein
MRSSNRSKQLDKQDIIAELRRVAEKLQTSHLSYRQFKKHGRISVSTVRYTFGTWNQAIQAAGLHPIPPGPTPELHQKRFSDDELLQEIIRLTQELGKEPPASEMRAKGRYSEGPYINRWGSFVKARQIAYAKYGFPKMQAAQAENSEAQLQAEPMPTEMQVIVPQTYKPSDLQRRKKVEFGEPIDFRGLRFAPINEQGVVYVFGMISRELGFLIESIRTDYPDCEGKRCIDPQRQRWEHVRIEFEYQSSNFRKHGHNPEDCDLIVCWIHDWEDCPVEVLELKSQINYLPNR